MRSNKHVPDQAECGEYGIFPNKNSHASRAELIIVEQRCDAGLEITGNISPAAICSGRFRGQRQIPD
jgi:hypothetical protein